MTTKILVSDKLSEDGLKILRDSGFPVDMKVGMTEDELCAVIPEYEALIIRSGTRVTKKVIDAGKSLRVIGRAGVGVDNIDVPYATEKGILVMNTPAANILSAAEHTCAMLLAMARNIPFAHDSMHRGEWTRSKFTGVELNGKVLGIIGVGRVGGEVAKRMKAFNMTMVGYDPFLPKSVADDLGVRLTTLEEVLKTADFMTIHTPLLPDTRNMISLPQFKMMKPNARLANVARGGIVNEDDLYTALHDHIITAAAFDVWCNEPANSEAEKKLFTLDNLVTTPHLGASTVEAQERVAIEVATAASKFLRDGVITNAINAPRGKLDPESASYVPLATRMGTFIHQVNGSQPIEEMEITYYGGLAKKDVKMLTVSAVIGVLRGIIGQDGANIINALPVAKAKGIAIKESKTETSSNYANMIEIEIKSNGKTSCVRGTVFGNEPRLVNFNGFRFNVPMCGNMLFVSYRDVPGVVGVVGTALGQNGISIQQMAVADKAKQAMMVITVDKAVSPVVCDKIKTAAKADIVRFVDIVDE
ncbi:MAG: phosphoglycerate dehydrogenase [Candidatus Methanomethylophilus sp.]|nr:phosphoglycerate dehydrogenase [Methanomethylophilus sp.]MDD3232956.1 phosphoglycerate dehydrogenase [Methanomethylophilus sp.]MDD4221673.1 phosphoglycerate dehydrogenase [Methanomethylophilus sp.]MDD4668471.1 phosphoglycerate dehydrogenase [Methanomethylophilus sp.]